MKKKELIYELATGTLIPETLDDSQMAETIEDEFGRGKLCGEWYEKIYDLKNKLTERLGKEEDKDIEQIMDIYSKICRHMSYKMYEYGKRYGHEK